MTTVLLTLALAAPAPKDPPKDPSAELVGRWTLESMTFAGTKAPDFDLTVTFAADGTTKSVHKDMVTNGNYKLYPKANPAEMETSNFGPDQQAQVVRVIYKVEGDTLTVCMGMEGSLPKSFDAGPGSNRLVMVLKRAKKD